MSTISSTISPFDFTSVRPSARKKDKDDPATDPNDPASLKQPNTDIMRLMAGLAAPKPAKGAAAPAGPAASTIDKAQDLYAQVTVNGKVVGTIYNNATSSDAQGKALDDTPGGPDLAQKRAEDLAAATGGTVVKAKTALTQTQWAMQKAGDDAAPKWDAVANEKQRWYAGTQSQQMLANPSMLVQAQLFGQQMGQEMGSGAAMNGSAPAMRVSVGSDTMASGGAAA